jgi:hypothetical protein
MDLPPSSVGHSSSVALCVVAEGDGIDVFRIKSALAASLARETAMQQHLAVQTSEVDQLRTAVSDLRLQLALSTMSTADDAQRYAGQQPTQHAPMMTPPSRSPARRFTPVLKPRPSPGRPPSAAADASEERMLTEQMAEHGLTSPGKWPAQPPSAAPPPLETDSLDDVTVRLKRLRVDGVR